MKITRQGERLRLTGSLDFDLSKQCFTGGRTGTDWLVTVLRPEGLVYFVCLAPQSAYDNYDKTFSSILDTVRFTR